MAATRWLYPVRMDAVFFATPAELTERGLMHSAGSAAFEQR